MKKGFIVILCLAPVIIFTGCGRSTDKPLDIPGAKIRYAALGSKVRGLDPGDIGDVTSASVASQSYECLYQYHYLKRPYELIPCLAESMPQVSKDGLTYIIKIRQDAYFFDDPCFSGGKGRQLVANDFIYTWKRIANIKYLSKNWWVFAGKVVGLDEFREYTKTVKSAREVDYSRSVEGLKALDNFTLQIKLGKPWPQITYLLAHLPTAPMAKEAVDYYGDQIINVMVGTGPLMLKKWQRGGKMVFVRNPRFRKELYPSDGEPGDRKAKFLDDAAKPLPLIDGMVFDVIEEDQPRWLLFMQGKIDASGIPKDFYYQAISPNRTLTPFLQKKGIELIIQADPDTYWFGFNMDDPAVGKNRPLRRAMSMAWNRQEYIDVFTNGRGIPAKGIFPPDFKEYDKTLKNPWTEFSMDKAKEQMKDAEKIAGGKITVTLSLPGTDTTVRQMGQYFKRSMTKIGINVKIDYSDWPSFQDKVNKRQAQIFAMGWVADYPDGQTFLQLFYSPNSSPGPNNFNYSNPTFDALYKKVEVMSDTPERLKLYRLMEKMICDDCPAILDLHNVRFVPYYKYLRNYKPNGFAYGTAKYTNIDLKSRKELIGR
ncbi:MAG: ABC transporter substrate-binding protein [Phycisphaerae bacterium]